MSDQIKAVEKTGIFDISNDEYHKSAGISRSGIVLLNQSAIHYWDKYINPNQDPEKETEDNILGSAVHHLALEKHTFFDVFHIMQKADKRTTQGKADYVQALASAEGKTIINSELYDKACKIVDSLLENDETKGLFTGGQHEKSIYWIDSDTGVLCKCRPDIWHPNILSDIKTTADGSEEAFKKSIYNYNYHIQAAMMIDGVYAVTGKLINEFGFVICENKRPFATGYYFLDPKSIEFGREEYKKGLARYKKFKEENTWKKGFGMGETSLPAWAFKRAMGE